MPHGPGSGGQLPPSFGGPFASLGSYMAAAAAAQAVRKPFDGPGSPLMASQGQGKMGMPPGMGGLGPMSAHPALRHFFAAAGHHQHMSEAQAGFLAQGLHPALAASLAAAGHSAHSLLPSQPQLPQHHNGNNNENGAPSFQSVLASLSAYRPRPSVSVSSPSTSPTSTPNMSSSPDFSALLRMQQPNLPSLAAAVARSMPSFVSPTQGGVSPPPSQQPPSPSAVAAAMAAVAAGRHSATNQNSAAAAESLNALRLKAREHELRLEMIKKMES